MAALCCQCARSVSEVVQGVASLQSIPRDLPRGSAGEALKLLRQSLTRRTRQWLGSLHDTCGFQEESMENLRSELRRGNYQRLMDVMSEAIAMCQDIQEGKAVEPGYYWKEYPGPAQAWELQRRR